MAQILNKKWGFSGGDFPPNILHHFFGCHQEIGDFVEKIVPTLLPKKTPEGCNPTRQISIKRQSQGLTFYFQLSQELKHLYKLMKPTLKSKFAPGLQALFYTIEFVRLGKGKLSQKISEKKPRILAASSLEEEEEKIIIFFFLATNDGYFFLEIFLLIVTKHQLQSGIFLRNNFFRPQRNEFLSLHISLPGYYVKDKNGICFKENKLRHNLNTTFSNRDCAREPLSCSHFTLFPYSFLSTSIAHFPIHDLSNFTADKKSFWARLTLWLSFVSSRSDGGHKCGYLFSSRKEWARHTRKLGEKDDEVTPLQNICGITTIYCCHSYSIPNIYKMNRRH